MPHAVRGSIHLTPRLSFVQISSLNRKERPSLRRGRQGASRAVVGLRITKSTASVNLLGNDRTCTLARLEATAAGCAIGVTGARTGNELRSSSLCSAGGAGRCLVGDGRSGICALTDDQKGHYRRINCWPDDYRQDYSNAF